MRLLKGLGALVALVGLSVGPPAGLILLIGNPWPPEGVSLTAPVTDTAILGLLAVIVWILWAQLMVCIIAEVVAWRANRTDVPAPLTLGVQRELARRLVSAVLVVGSASAAVGTTAATAAEAAVTVSHHEPAMSAAPAADAPAVDEPAVESDRPAMTVEAQRLDSLYAIAERHLGDGNRWPEIAALNEGRTMVDGTVFASADQIRPGWQLLIPAEAVAEGTETVESGDSLSQIAFETTGDATTWPDLYEANKDVIGSDPDLIYPGQVLVLPGASGPASPSESVPPAVEEHPAPSQPVAEPPATPVSPATEGAEQISQDATPAKVADAETELADSAVGITALRALLATAACLAVGMAVAVAANRRRQMRHRKLGHTIAPMPTDVAEAEEVVAAAADEAQDDVTFLDRALRYVAASCREVDAPLPLLGAAVMGSKDLTLLFTVPALSSVPEGWTATDDARAWMLARQTFLEADLDEQPAPYPALVSVGTDEGGHTWLLDLETIGMCGIGGAPDQVAGVTRFLVAELAVNAWAEGSEVLLSESFAAAMVPMNPARLRQVNTTTALARAEVLATEMAASEANMGADVLQRRRDGVMLDTANPVVVVLPARPDDSFVTAIEARARSRVVLVHRTEDSPAIVLNADGSAFLPMWGITVTAFSMDESVVPYASDLLAASRDLTSEPVADMTSDDGPLGKYAKADGSLRDLFVQPRRRDGSDRASVLPEPDEVYLATAATTPEDLATVAPRVSEEVREELAALDPTLDQDIADWFDETSPRPKIRLLGPAAVSSLAGGDPAAIPNAAGTVSFIAYLAVQDRGVTGERAASDCGWKTVRTVQNRATDARVLLGPRPDGSDWLLDATVSEGARLGSHPTYDLVRGPGGVLTDADLFVRLKFRAGHRGNDGAQDDLVMALSLVAGQPFEGASESRFRWLFKSGRQRHDETLVATIHAAAHILATRSLPGGRTDLVRLACEAARTANPHSDIAWLDQAAAAEADGDVEAANDLVRYEVLDRFDEDLPDRTEVIVEQRRWGATG